MINIKSFFYSLLTCISLVSSAHAQLTIFSEDFENTGIADGTFGVNSFGSLGIIAGNSNLLNPADTGASSAWLNPVPSELGDIFGVLLNSGTAQVDLGETFLPNSLYELSFTNFRRDDINGDELVANIMTTSGTVLATQTFAPVTTPGLLENRTLSWTTTGQEVGENIRIQFVDTTPGTMPQVAIDNIVLQVTPQATGDISWSGSINSVWDIQTTSNWTDASNNSTQFSQFNNVTFGNVANRSVVVNEPVSTTNVVFNSGGGAPYQVTGSGGISVTGNVDITSGTVQLRNSGNSYTGTTTIASGARLEINSASVGNVALNGTLSVGGQAVVEGEQRTFYSENFDGNGKSPLNGTQPDTTTDGNTWVAVPAFSDNGSNTFGGGPGGGSATLAFEPIDNAIYTLEATLEDVASATGRWFGVGFARGQSANTGGGERFISSNVTGIAWALYRGDASQFPNQTFLGNPAVNSGTASPANWATNTNTSGVDVDIRITLDTTGGAGNWTTLMEAKTPNDNDFQVIRAEETLISELITSVGFAYETQAVTGRVSSFSLTGDEQQRIAGQTLSVNGDFTMDASSTLELDIAVLGQDFVDVTGVANLNGTIDVTLLGNVTPISGSQYTLLSADNIIDSGVNFMLPSGAVASIVNSTDLVLTFVPDGLRGDFNGDNIVDLADYTIWRNNLGAAETVLPSGSFIPGNGTVDSEEYLTWRGNFGATLTTINSTAAVPEPASLTLLVFIGIGGTYFLRHPQRA